MTLLLLRQKGFFMFDCMKLSFALLAAFSLLFIYKPAQAQLELERKNDRYLLVSTSSEKVLLAFPAVNFIQAMGKNGEKLKNSSSVITATGEIEYDWIVKGTLYTTSDSVGFIMGFHKVKDEHTVLFSLALSDTTPRQYEICFFYADSANATEGIRMAGKKNRNKELRNKYKLAYGFSSNEEKVTIATDTCGFYTTTGRAVLLTNTAHAKFNFKQPSLFVIHTNVIPLKGKLLFNIKKGL